MSGIVGHRGLLLADGFWSQVVSQLNFIGADGATTTTDDTGLRAWTFSGNAQIDTAVSDNGTSSLLLDGTGDYISTPDADALEADPGNMTVDVTFRAATTGTLMTVVSKRQSSGGAGWAIYKQADNTINFGSFSGPVISLTSSTTVATGSFYRVRVVRNGTGWTLSVNGSQQASGTQSSAPPTSTAGLFIGRDGTFNTTRDFNGWIGGFRMLKGVALPSNYTPVIPFPVG